DAGGVAAIGGDRDIEDHAVYAGIIGIFEADRRIGGQLDNAVMVVAEFQFGIGTEHAIGNLAADITLADGHVLARNIGAGEGEDGFEAGAGVGGAANHVDQFAGAGIDLADAQLVGIGMLFGGDDMGGDESAERLALIFHAFEFGPDQGQRIADLISRRVGVEV